ncbi:MAG: type B 50S ribosomal protein L31 [Bdellovibrionales bacterium]|nr:type B 50S ribosomal protein L31 [Oligoflexia bacterium]
MQDNLHPVYRPVVFKDLSSGFTFITRSTIQTKEMITMEDGKEYPLSKVEISSKSHPFYTGQDKRMDTTGRVEKFMNKYKHIKK